MDRIVAKILEILQRDATTPIAAVAEHAGLSPSPCWRRIQKLDASGIIQRRVVLIDSKKVNLGVNVFVAIRTSHHDAKWAQQFCRAVSLIPEVVEFYRMTGRDDYLLRIVVPDIQTYDSIYMRLIATAELSDVTSSFAMETIKYTTALPLKYAVT
jgi:Lrp/AsnC family transcriptional regulator